MTAVPAETSRASTRQSPSSVAGSKSRPVFSTGEGGGWSAGRATAKDGSICEQLVGALLRFDFWPIFLEINEMFSIEALFYHDVH